VPQIFVGRRSLGGFDDIKRLDDEGALLGAVTRTEDDGPVIEPTPEVLLAGRALIPEHLRAAFQERAEFLFNITRQGSWRPGSQPTVRAFLQYAVTGRPSQGQHDNVPLNVAGQHGDGEGARPLLLDMDAPQLGALLGGVLLHLLDEFADPGSGEVDYVRMHESPSWGSFLAVAGELADPRLQSSLLAMDEAAKKAFYLNLYNSMTFHGVVAYGRRSGLWNMYCFYIAPAVSYSLAGVAVSLDDVENGILRAQPKYFSDPDQSFQRRVQVDGVDPRIHMALNCGARGCPATAVYSGVASELDQELDDAVAGFVADDKNVRVVPPSGPSSGASLEVSELFKMYISDFTRPGAKANNRDDQEALARWILQFLQGRKRELLADALDQPAARRITLKWLPYDWTTNGPDMPLEDRIYRATW